MVAEWTKQRSDEVLATFGDNDVMDFKKSKRWYIEGFGGKSERVK